MFNFARNTFFTFGTNSMRVKSQFTDTYTYE